MSLQLLLNRPQIEFHEANHIGRDLIAGDLHGSFDALQQGLEAAKFDPTCDRLFCVGDLTDRGPKNVECLHLLNEPWFHLTVGNHDIAFALNILALNGDNEALAIDQKIQEHYAVLAARNGGLWYVMSEPETEMHLLNEARLVADQPHVIIVGKGSPERFNIVHATLHNPACMNPVFTSDEGIEALAGTINPGRIETMTESRGYWENEFHPKELSPTYCGHNKGKVVTRDSGHINLDTGAGHKAKPGYERNHTILCHQTGQIWSTSTTNHTPTVESRLE